ESAYNQKTLSHWYGALCINSLLAYSIQEGSMTAQDYKNFIEYTLLPKMNTFSKKYSILVLDNAQIHKGQHLSDICQEKGDTIVEVRSTTDKEKELAIDIEAVL
ncbi:28354_t:CDS:2, partial [Gigaspora margarita]